MIVAMMIVAIIPGTGRVPTAGARCGAPRPLRAMRRRPYGPAPRTAASTCGASRRPAAGRHGEEPGAAGPSAPRQPVSGLPPVRVRPGMRRDRPAERVRAAGTDRYPLRIRRPGFLRGDPSRSKGLWCRTCGRLPRLRPSQKRPRLAFVPRAAPMPRDCLGNVSGKAPSHRLLRSGRLQRINTGESRLSLVAAKVASASGGR